MVRLRVLAALAALSGCVVSDEPVDIAVADRPLLGGEPDTGDPAVIALTRGGFPFCTGTIVGPRTVLTAAHCIDGFRPDDTAVGIFFGSSIDSGSQISARGGRVKPGWDGIVGPNKPNDIGLLFLSSPEGLDIALPMNSSGANFDTAEVCTDIDPEAAEDLRCFETEPCTVEGEVCYRHVGFGQDNVDPDLADSGNKKTGVTTIHDVDQVITSGDSNVSTCFGDSGGPGMITADGVELVTGVHSYVSGSSCQIPAGDTRVDQHIDWLLETMNQKDFTCLSDGVCATRGCTSDPDCASCGADGVCSSDCAEADPDCPNKQTGDACRIKEECGAGECVVWEKDTTSRFCSQECVVDSECPNDMICRTFGNRSLCYYRDKDRPPGALGDSCAGDAECGSRLCREGECVARCDTTINYNCALEQECRELTDGSFCFSVAKGDDGGCRTSSGGGPALLGLLALAYLIRRRRF